MCVRTYLETPKIPNWIITTKHCSRLICEQPGCLYVHCEVQDWYRSCSGKEVIYMPKSALAAHYLHVIHIMKRSGIVYCNFSIGWVLKRLITWYTVMVSTYVG